MTTGIEARKFVINERTAIIRFNYGPDEPRTEVVAMSRSGRGIFMLRDYATNIMVDQAAHEGKISEMKSFLGRISDGDGRALSQFRVRAEEALNWYQEQHPELKGKLELGVALLQDTDYKQYLFREIGVWEERQGESGRSGLVTAKVSGGGVAQWRSPWA